MHGASLTMLFMLSVMYLYVPPPPTLTPARPELHLSVMRLDIDALNELNVFEISFLMAGSFVALLCYLESLICKPRYILFNTCTNTLPKAVSCSNEMYKRLILQILILFYVILYDYYLIILLPGEYFDVQLITKSRMNLAIRGTRIFHCCMFNALTGAYACLVYPFYSICTKLHSCEIIATWCLTLHLILSSDVHPNPGPILPNNDFCGGFLSFCNWNLNSLSKDDFYRVSFLETNNAIFNYDIISLCETSLNDTIEVPENILPGFKYHPCNHPDGNKSGGVGIFYKESLPIRIRDDLSFEECIVSELIFGCKRIFFTVLYRNPVNKASSPEFNKFLENLENLYHKIKLEKPYTMLFSGDFNAHSQAWYSEGDTNAEGILLDNLFSNLNLTQLISEPTHFFRDDCNPSCIDLLITDQPNIVLNSGVRPSLDPTVKHQITFCKINFKIPPLPNHFRKLWHFSRADVNLIRRAISEFPWEAHLRRYFNPNHQVNLLNQSILNIMSNFVPNEVKKVCPQQPEWLNRSVKNLLRKQNKLFRKYKKNGYQNADKVNLDQVRTECCEAIKNAKEKHLKELGTKLANPTTGQKMYWKILNKFLNKCKVSRIPPLFVQDKFITDCKEKASIFNEFFSSQCTPILNDSQLPALNVHTNSRISSFEITHNEINEIISGMNINKAHGPDNISVNMVKLCGEHLCVPLKIIFDNILKTGIFPDQWKEANVTPVHKKNDKQLIANYRPISLLPILAKVFERIIFKNLYNYLNSNNLITNNQSGFRPGDSVVNQLLSIVHDIAFEDKNCLEVRSIFLDMSKAFDKVWHEGLIFKLKQNGVEGNLMALFQNYLTNRKQRVVINGSESTWGDIKAGVPQGSVLGPLLFLIYINDLEVDIKSSVKFFADDTSIFSIVRDPTVSAEELNHDLGLINRWANQWKMSFNPDPTKQAEEILFSYKRKSPDHPPIYFNNIEVKRVSDHKHLGLVLDSKLSFVKHINEKIAIARKGIGVIKHLAPYIPLKSRDQIYKMHVRPHLDYCDIIFHVPAIQSEFDSSLTLNYQMNALERTQYQAALAVSGAWKGTNRDKIYEELGWETLDLRRFFRRLTQFYKIMNNLTPEYLKIPIPTQQCHLFGYRSSNALYPIMCRTDGYRKSFFPDSVCSWNEIGPELRGAESLSIFKKKLLQIIRPVKKSLYDVSNPNGIRWIFQLRVGLSPLRAHKKSHKFPDTPDDACLCNIGAETTQHFLLKCPIFNTQRNLLFQAVNPVIMANNMNNLNDRDMVKLFLYGHEKLKFYENQSILRVVMNFIGMTSRFSQTPNNL